jgi:hypothetical protein
MGRVRTGWGLARASWAVLRADSSLAIYPALAILVAMLAFWAVAGVGITVGQAVSAPWLTVAFLVAGIYAAVYFVVYFNVALAAAAQQSIEGRDTGLRDGLAVARTRRGLIAKWALLEVALGLLVSVIGSLLSEAGAKSVARLVAATAGLAWSVATFFVIPVLALEGLGPHDAITRSIDLIRARWGEAIVGRTGIGAVVFLFAALPAAGLAVLSTELEPVNPALAGVTSALFTLAVVVAIVLGSSLSVIFRVELYRYATAGELTGGFARGDVEAAFGGASTAPRSPRAHWSPLKRILLVLAVVGVVGTVLGAFDEPGVDMDTPDADQQAQTATACLRGARLDVKSDVPPHNRRGDSSEYRLDVDGKAGKHDHLAFVYLFDDKDTAGRYVDQVKSDAEGKPLPSGVTIQQRGTAVLRLFADPAEAADIRRCIDKATKPPPHKK